MGFKDKKRTPQESATRKARLEKNKLKEPKKRKFASEEVKSKKLKIKEAKREKFFAKNKNGTKNI